MKQQDQPLTLRHAVMADLPAIAAVEAACFPPAEAASEADFAARLAVYPGHFWLLWEGDRLVSFVNGMTTDEPDLRDEMYQNAALHQPDGAWQMIFGVNTLPDCRRKGYAARALQAAIDDARAAGRKGLVLTCKDHMVHYYAKFGFVEEGMSGSTHGGAAWHQMRLTF